MIITAIDLAIYLIINSNDIIAKRDAIESTIITAIESTIIAAIKSAIKSAYKSTNIIDSKTDKETDVIF